MRKSGASDESPDGPEYAIADRENQVVNLDPNRRLTIRYIVNINRILTF